MESTTNPLALKASRQFLGRFPKSLRALRRSFWRGFRPRQVNVVWRNELPKKGEDKVDHVQRCEIGLRDNGLDFHRFILSQMLSRPFEQTPFRTRRRCGTSDPIWNGPLERCLFHFGTRVLLRILSITFPSTVRAAPTPKETHGGLC